MLNRAVLKQSAKDKLKGNWGAGVLMGLLYFLIAVGGSLIHHGISLVFEIFINPVLTVGWFFAFLTLVQTGGVKVEDVFGGFARHYAKSLGLQWWMSLWVLLWTLLLVVPGVMKAIAYSQAYFIIGDNPEVKVRDAMKISMKMTEGHKWDLFVLDLSFLGWALLTIPTLFIGALWLAPYMTATYAATYLELKRMSLESGACTEDMFNGKQRLVVG